MSSSLNLPCNLCVSLCETRVQHIFLSVLSDSNESAEGGRVGGEIVLGVIYVRKKLDLGQVESRVLNSD